MKQNHTPEPNQINKFTEGGEWNHPMLPHPLANFRTTKNSSAGTTNQVCIVVFV